VSQLVLEADFRIDTFFARNASEPQKFSGFMIFVKMLEGLAPHRHCLEKLFSKNFMNCLINQVIKEDRYLHRAAAKALRAIEVTASTEQKIIPTILRRLLSHHGSYDFDQRTNTKTIEAILQASDPEHADRVFKVLISVFGHNVQDE
jgi:DNA polymerase phi